MGTGPAVLDATRQWTLAVPAVSAFVTSLVRGFADRVDVLKDTAMAVIEAYPRYDPGRLFVGWAIGVARNQVYLHVRRKGREWRSTPTPLMFWRGRSPGPAPPTAGSTS